MQPSLKFIFASLVLSFSFITEASTTVTRTASHGTELMALVTKDFYRTETYNGPYQEEITYQETEHYTDQERYMDYVYKCQTQRVPTYKCENERVCDYKSPRNCRTERKCGNVYESKEVCKMTPETKFRNVQRTRTVTKTRFEHRCCKDQTRQVLDRTWTADVKMSFPFALQTNQTESFELELGGEETKPELTIKPIQTILTYEPLIRAINANLFEIQMMEKMTLH